MVVTRPTKSNVVCTVFKTANNRNEIFGEVEHLK